MESTTAMMMMMIGNATASVMKDEASGSLSAVERTRMAALFKFTLFNVVYAIGILGNIAALVILFHKDKRRNRKHLLMLRCLTINDLIAMVGTLSQIYIGKYRSRDSFCHMHVIWRAFGLFSGCVALVMAGERYLALTRPFAYQKVTYPMIVRCMMLLWVVALSLTVPPLFGFGLYDRVWVQNKMTLDWQWQCGRYRDADHPTDIAYAYVWFSFGSLLCLSIVWCNLMVARALRRLGRRNCALRRISRASSRAKPLLTATCPPPEVGITAEERAFSKLMFLLSISFLICWMPQMVSIPLAQWYRVLPEKRALARKLITLFQVAADVLLCVHFTLDPYIYVLLRMPRPRFPLLKPLCRFCWPSRSHGDSFTGVTEQHGSSGDPPTPITEAPSTPVSEKWNEAQLVSVAV